MKASIDCDYRSIMSCIGMGVLVILERILGKVKGPRQWRILNLGNV